VTAVYHIYIGVGKTTMIQSYLHQTPEKYTNPTVGSMFFAKSIIVDSKQHNLQIWDTAGQERFRAMTPLCFKDADGVIMVCDLTDKSTLMGLRDWLKIVQDNAPEQVSVCIAGNKMDIEDQIQINEGELKEFSEYLGCSYVMTSAWQNKGIEVKLILPGCI
jgi:small GTP-binding protein